MGDARYYSVCDTLEFGPQIVDQSGNKGAYLSMALDPQGNPAISYTNSNNGDLLFAESSVRILQDPSGATWPVGAERTIKWRGAGEVDIQLSTDGGATYETVASSETGGSDPEGGTYVLVVPHQPSRFCKVRVERTTPFSTAESDSFFTIETSIALLNFVVTLDDLGGNNLAWTSDPGPADLGGYRLEKGAGEDWSTLAFTTETAYHDDNGTATDGYRLYASNRLGEEFFLGESSSSVPPLSTRLHVWPVPFAAGDLVVSYATGGPGGSSADSEVAVYDVAGRRIAVIEQGNFVPGIRQARWDGRGANGALVPSGVYFVRAVTGESRQTQKITVVR
jgi:hypothetical protein